MKGFLVILMFFCVASNPVFSKTIKSNKIDNTIGVKQENTTVQARIKSRRSPRSHGFEKEGDLDHYKKIMNLKLLHDPIIVREIINGFGKMEGMSTSKDSLSVGTESVFNDKDNSNLKTSIAKKKPSMGLNKNLEKQLEFVEKDPFNTFMNTIKNYQVPSFTESDLKEINSVDKKAIPNYEIMATEAGPEIGSGRVEYIYND